MKYEYQTIGYDNNLPARIEYLEKRSSEFRSEPHWHKEIEILYVLEGELSVTKYNVSTAIKSGDIFLINSGEIHSINADSGGEVKAVRVYLSYDFAKKFDDALDMIYFKPDSGTKAEAQLKEMVNLLANAKQQADEDFSTIKQYALIMEVYHILFTSCRRKKQISLYGNCKVGFRNAKIVMEYAEEHYRENLTTANMAALVGLSPTYFSNYFKKTTGAGFAAFLNSVRLRHALEDLISNGLSVTEAAENNGFTDAGAFVNVCKRSYGVTPLQFKKQQLKVS